MPVGVDIDFQDLSFTAGRRKIIKCISGKFKAGELSAIMGPSGAGKSTLMNILVGYVTSGVSGQIRINGEPRKLAVFNKMASYLLQEDLLQPFLTVREAMTTAAHLKLGMQLSIKEKNNKIEEILATLGLKSCAKTFCDKLSGGQRKRVSVALELVSDPLVIFLDEPSTGLDVVSTNQTLQLLKLLASQGRTVICTIHQPTATLFHQFDNVYMVGSGKCIYQGEPSQLVSFLSNLGYECPETHNPADYVFEVLSPDLINNMAEEMQNGKLVWLDQKSQTLEQASRDDLVLPNSVDLNFAVPFWMQFRLLLSRMMIQKRRHKGGLWLQVIHHIFSALLIGCIFQGVGQDARRPFDNFKFVLCVSVFFMYTHCMVPVLTYPIDVKIMKREFFNRWYSLKAYYLAKTISTIPLILVLGFMFTVIVYIMSDQPMELKRFAWFALNCSLIALTSEGLGILIGFNFNCTNGTVVGPSTMAPILMLSMHGMGYGQTIGPLMYYIMKASYLRFGLVSIITALYLDNRVMRCYEDEDPYCYYRDARLLVRDLAMEGDVTVNQMLGLAFYCVIFRVAAFFSLRYRTTTEFSNTVLVYMMKIIKKK
ncbi:unnamed protein product [Nezara viridula]|uniref:ABC transporter domain-containing protein n=1 Tax=Nezara viridula TaxID=85310 RepID=A0A9P0HS76_NEZVI|nr:unnamed protein product [Nezara viridula]